MTAPQSFARGRVTGAAQLAVGDILQRALHNAELWELPRLRGTPPSPPICIGKH